MSNDKFGLIRDWASARNLYQEGDSHTQFLKLQEETGELAKAILKRDDEEVFDAIGDIVVVLTNLTMLYELERAVYDIQHGRQKKQAVGIEGCIDIAYNAIKNRTGQMFNGTFVKDDE